MISRGLKDFYYRLMGGPMRVSGWFYRAVRAPRTGCVKVHLGPGQQKYLPGWYNVDANLFTAKIDVWADIRRTLPFRDGTVDVFYSHHVIEHLADADLPRHFADMYRCLKPGGYIRIGGPNGDVAIRKFIEGDSAWFGDFPDKRTSIGGRFANHILCRGEHLTILTESYLNELLQPIGFVNVTRCEPTATTRIPQWIDARVLSTEWESTPDAPHTLLIEAEKPGRPAES